MKKFMNNVLIIDGSYMLMRGMTAPGLADLETKSGIKSGGFYGFIRMLNKVIKESPGYYPVICWDYGHNQRRLDLFPNYKHHADRNAAPPIPGSPDDEFLQALRMQRADLIEFTQKLRIPNIRVQGWEGDDLIYLITKVCNKGIIVTDDKDFIQLISDTISVNRTMSDQFMDIRTMDQFYRYPRYEYYKSIIGDPSDNISHCLDGLGGKGASVIADVMEQIVNETECSPHDYGYIFEQLKDEKWNETWKSVRGLSKKIVPFTEQIGKFKLNMQLADFVYVEVPVGFQTMIESCIEPTINQKPKLLEAYRYLSKYEIKGIDPGILLSKLVGAHTILING